MSAGIRYGSLFSGAAGLDRAVESVFGATPAWHSDIDEGACKVLAHRYPGVPNLGDITAVDWADVERVDVLAGGFPCQDLSAAARRKGMRPGTRSGLWADFLTAIGALRPPLVLIENVRGLLHGCAESDLEPCPGCVGDSKHRPVLRALGRVLGDLAAVGFDAEWTGLPASQVGAPHERFRVFVLAWPATDAPHVGHERRGRARRRRLGSSDGLVVAADSDDRTGHGQRPRPEPRQGSVTAADAARDRRREGRPEPARLVGRPDAAERSEQAAADTHSDGRALLGRQLTIERHPHRRDSPDTAWGDYEPAIRRWERILGRPAPEPTEPGTRGGRRLSRRFDEWMLGWPEGWVADVPGLTYREAIKLCGNGAVTLQAEAALAELFARVGEAVA